MRAFATIRFDFKTEKHLLVAIKAMEPENRGSITSRFKACIESKDTFLILNLEAKNASALRTAINTYSNWAVLVRHICLTFKAS